jgi:hypothetical protein
VDRQKGAAAAIRLCGGRGAGANYLLAVKGHQKALHEDVKLFFADAVEQGDEQLLRPVMEPASGHGRLDERTVWANWSAATGRSRTNRTGARM